MCGRSRPNEAFSGGNHRRHLCRECARHPQRHQREKELALLGMLLDQSNISTKNIKMAAAWANDDAQAGEWCDETDGEEPADEPDMMAEEPGPSWCSLLDDDIPF
jgi:hypothetical protein